MFLSAKDAQFIVEKVKQTIHHDVNIMDENGIIIASTNAGRISQAHCGAIKLLQEQEHLCELIISDDDPSSGVQQGINLPICVHNKIVGVIGITGSPGEVGIFGSVIKMMAELMIERIWQTNQEYQLETARSLFLEDWIFSDAADFSELEMRGKLLGFDVSLPRFLVLLHIQPKSQNPHIEQTAQEIQNIHVLNLIRTHIGDNSQNFCTSVRQRILILLCGEKKEDVRKNLNDIRNKLEGFYPIVVYGGVSTVSKKMSDLRQRYLEANSTLRVAMSSHNGGISFYDAVSLNGVLQMVSPSIKQNLVEMVFSGLSDEEIHTAIETIHLFFKHNGDIKQAANEAFIHKNTFQYRMEKVKKQTGYWLKNPQDTVMLYLILQFYNEGFHNHT